MAVSLKKQIEKARSKRDLASAAVYASEPTGRVPFSGCLALASPEVVAAYRAADDALHALRLKAVSTGKAYWGTFNQLTWYR